MLTQKILLDPLKKKEKKLDRKEKETKETKNLPPIKFFLFLAMMIVSASVKRFIVSRMRDFFSSTLKCSIWRLLVDEHIAKITKLRIFFRLIGLFSL